MYKDTDSANTSLGEIKKDINSAMKLYLNSIYGTMVTDYKEINMEIKDFIVLHADGQPIMVKKEAITVIARMSDGTIRLEIDNQIWLTDDKYEDVIKRLFEV